MALNQLPSSLPEFLSHVLGSRHVAEGVRRPYVTLTFAQSLDAKIAGVGGQQLILSGNESMVMTHWMRTMHDAILVGIGTALNDDPQLNVRHLPPPPTDRPYSLPRPIILDSRLRLPPTCKLLQNYKNGTGRRPWIISASPEASARDEWLTRKHVLESLGARVFIVPVENGKHFIGSIPRLPSLPDHIGTLSIPDALRTLSEQGIRSLMVEGGANVIVNFLRTVSNSSSSLVDTLVVTIAPRVIGDGGIAYSLHEIPNLRHVRTQVFGKDAVIAMEVVCA